MIQTPFKSKGLYYTYSLVVFLAFVYSCKPETSKTKEAPALTQDVEMVTSKGTIVLRLYDETPLHRDNYLKLFGERFYDSILFHRVIENFMIQSGDPTSKHSAATDTLGNGDLPYTIPAELVSSRYHKRGVLAAARDNNPERASSSTQFYIVHGRIYTDSTLTLAEDRINTWLADNRVVNKPENKALVHLLETLYQKGENTDSIQLISGQIQELSKEELAKGPRYTIPEMHRETYKTVGGAAHLDQNYTVFGEVISGMAVVDSIAIQSTDSLDRPLNDIRILSTRLIDRK